jgi:NAD(P)-dependent dehydrogenase (short-subunit alcohol dehydrogenase family)
LTLLVNNASLFEPDEVQSLHAALWERHFAVNLRAPAFLTRDFAHQVPDGQEGAVVNIIDQRVWKPNPQFFSYTLSKSALLTATRTMAQALAPRIRVNAIGPGPTLTSSRQSDGDFARQGEALPLRRPSTPEDIAEAVAFLAKARSVTGQMLAVDGGQHLAWETPDVLAVRE